MVSLLIVYAAFLTLFIVGGIYYYEEKLRDAADTISDYKRALSLSKTNSGHYTFLQLENKKQKELTDLLDYENKLLQNQINRLKLQLADRDRIQYESTAYKTNIWDSKAEQ